MWITIRTKTTIKIRTTKIKITKTRITTRIRIIRIRTTRTETTTNKKYHGCYILRNSKKGSTKFRASFFILYHIQ